MPVHFIHSIYRKFVQSEKWQGQFHMDILLIIYCTVLLAFFFISDLLTQIKMAEKYKTTLPFCCLEKIHGTKTNSKRYADVFLSIKLHFKKVVN